jgi:hypothetical protein
VSASDSAAIGVGVVVLGAVAGIAVSFLLRTRLPAAAVAALLAASGAAIGWGGMTLQPDPPLPQVVFAVLMLAVLVPFHVRIVVGPFGPRGRNGPEKRRRG